MRGAAAPTRPPPPVAAETVVAGAPGQPMPADRGNGSFCNPVLAGDHPDPAILKDGSDYYLTFSSLQCCPGLVIWHSRDLVNWAPITAALNHPVGSVRAANLVKHDGRHFIYFTASQCGRVAILVVHADDVRGPWSAPVDLGLDGGGDPAHAVDEDGRRHLLVDGMQRVALSDDGLTTAGPLLPAHRPGATLRDVGPDALALDGPRLVRRGEFIYRLSAAGGSGRPAGSHTVTVARSRSVLGPWEDCPFNPVARTHDADQPWWTSGCPCLVEGPAGDWWMLCHGLRNGDRTLGRQTLLEPIEWTRDGWFRASGSRLDRPQRKPRGGIATIARPPLCDDFSRNRLGVQWSFYDAVPGELARAHYDGTGLVLRGRGTGLRDCSPLTCVASDSSYEAEIDFELDGAAQGGLALFHDARGFVGVGIGDGRMHTYSYGQEHSWMQQAVQGRRHRLRITNRRHLLTFEHATADGHWVRNPWLTEVSALHQTAVGGFASPRLALFAAGAGHVRLRQFSYQRIGPDA